MNAEKGVLISEHECHKQRGMMSAAGELKNLQQISSFFKTDAWSFVINSVNKANKKREWLCYECKKDLGKGDSLACDSCLSWSHVTCLRIKSLPKKKFWICRHCHSNSVSVMRASPVILCCTHLNYKYNNRHHISQIITELADTKNQGRKRPAASPQVPQPVQKLKWGKIIYS